MIQRLHHSMNEKQSDDYNSTVRYKINAMTIHLTKQIQLQNIHLILPFVFPPCYFFSGSKRLKKVSIKSLSELTVSKFIDKISVYLNDMRKENTNN